MNECEKYMEMMSAMLDGELDAADSERLVAHMSSCAQCRELYELLSAVTGSEVWELPDVPEGLHEHIMSGVKSAASARKKDALMRKIRPWAMAAACVVIIAGVVFGVPRFFRMGNSSAPAALNTTASANGNSAPADNCAPADAAAPAEAPAADNNAEDIFGSPSSADLNVPENSEGSAFNYAGNSGRGDETTYDSPEAAPVPEPESEPEEPKLDIDIDSSVVTVESGGKSTTENLNRNDTLIWLRAVIETRAGAGINAAKIEISRLEGTDYEVYIYHDGSKLMGSLTEDLENSIELKKLADFVQFQEMADSAE